MCSDSKVSEDDSRIVFKLFRCIQCIPKGNPQKKSCLQLNWVTTELWAEPINLQLSPHFRWRQAHLQGTNMILTECSHYVSVSRGSSFAWSSISRVYVSCCFKQFPRIRDFPTSSNRIGQMSTEPQCLVNPPEMWCTARLAQPTNFCVGLSFFISTAVLETGVFEEKCWFEIKVESNLSA